MSRLSRIRIALGFIREGDPGAWQCFLCGGWTDGNSCPNHRVRVMREPSGPRPIAPAAPPAARPIEVRIVPAEPQP